MIPLAEGLQQTLQAITGSRPFPWVWLATWDPQLGARVRTVRILAYNLRQGTFTFSTHKNHAKIRQMTADPRGQLCLLRESPPLQARLDVQLKATAGTSHPQGDRMWQKIAPADKVRLYQGHPQLPRVPENFWLVEAQIQRAQVLSLEDNPWHREFTLAGDQWSTRELQL